MPGAGSTAPSGCGTARRATLITAGARLLSAPPKDSRIAPGDVLGSGTVGGGSVREAIRKGYEGARWLEPGDEVALEVEGIGILSNTLSAKEGVDAGYRYLPKGPTPTPEWGSARDYIYRRGG